MAKTVIALFDEMSVAQRAVQELVDRGFNRDRISVMASNRAATDADVAVDTVVETAEGAAAGAGIGAVLGGMAGLLVGIGALAIPGIGPIIAAGPLAVALAGAGLGAATGGVIGALADAGVPEEQAEYYAEGVRRGGVLVTVHTDDGTEDRAIDILNSFGPVDINRRVSDWQQTGWTGYDSDAGEDHLTDEATFPTSGGTATAGSHAMDGGTGYVETQPTGTGSGRKGNGSGVVGSGAGYSGNTTTSNRQTFGSPSSYPGIRQGEMEPSRRFEDYEDDFRRDYEERFANADTTYDSYSPAYRFGYDLGLDNRYRGMSWEGVKTSLRNEWGTSHPHSVWSEVEAAVEYGWNRVREGVRDAINPDR